MFIDTNCILRYILNDIPEQAEMAASVIADGAETYPEVIPEIVYVLEKVYKINREDISDTVIEVLDEIEIERKDIIKETLRIYKSTKLDYVDCLLLAGLKINRHDFLSFDKKLMNAKKHYVKFS